MPPFNSGRTRGALEPGRRNGPPGWGAGRVGSAPPPPLHARRLGGALRPQPKRRNGRPGPCPSGPREHLSMRGDALPYITIYRAVHGDRRVGSTCLRRRPLSRRVGSTRGLPPPPSRFHLRLPPACPPPAYEAADRLTTRGGWGEEGVIRPRPDINRLHVDVGGPALGGAEPVALRGPRGARAYRGVPAAVVRATVHACDAAPPERVLLHAALRRVGKLNRPRRIRRRLQGVCKKGLTGG